MQRVCFQHQNSSVYSVSYPSCWDQEEPQKKGDETISDNLAHQRILSHMYVVLFSIDRSNLTAEVKLSLADDFCLVNGYGSSIIIQDMI